MTVDRVGPALGERVRMRTNTKGGEVVGLQLSLDSAWVLWDDDPSAARLIPYRFLTPIGS